jgi:competence ComEA-like helix-hairpin-helix protein
LLDLTRQERKVLIVLGALAALGLAVLAFKTYVIRPQLVVIPAGPAGTSLKGVVDRENRVNINTSDAERIATLPDIGPKTARKIISYRDSHGSFLLKEDIMKVGGIGPKTFDKIKDLIVLE